MDSRNVRIAAAALVLVAVIAAIALYVMPGPTAPVSSTSTATASSTSTPTPSAVVTTASPVPTASPSPTPTPIRRPPATPTPLATTAVAAGVTYENPILGYRITLPVAVRRAQALVTPVGDGLGLDLYTYRTEAQDSAACLRDGGARGGPDDPLDLIVDASLNPSGLSAEAWATTPRAPGAQPFSMHMLVERTTVGGREAVRLVRDQAQNREPTMYVIRGDDRMFTIYLPTDSIPSRLPSGVFDAIGMSLRVVAATARPTPTPGPAVPLAERARTHAEQLARAFTARDADALGQLTTPMCWLGTVPIVPPGVGVGGSTRAVIPLLAMLREQFGRGLGVSVDPAIQTQVDGTGAGRTESLFVRSTWTVPSGATRMDLFLSEIDGRLYWTSLRWEQTPPPPCELLRIIHGAAIC
jgi:hypothetical protein